MPFSWDERSRRYRNADGRYLPAQTVRAAVDVVVSATGDHLKAITSQIRQGTLSIPAWQQQMAAETKALHLATAAASRGGWAQVSPSDWGWIGSKIKPQYQYLRQFAQDIASGKQLMNGTLEARAALYAEAARGTATAMARRMAATSGQTEEKNVLGAADHCGSCLSATAQGWVPIGTLSAPGSRECHARCHCFIQTRALAAA